ncbi:hypothetical protein RJ639_010140 [Escallonia herrerae]|uniref:Major pollen allergen Ole e 6-like n=1 Tax=Escallonia herrerae TaxID=1293975 RepID=A0AA88VR54_9ASTE|nr:hypothetical protein RJ639_023909 [Escallonia herrerae]KAK3013781.1 hypothetical protein RJ639_010140 [Escallonia herrerae]
MAKKLVAVFLMCIVVLAAVHVNAQNSAEEEYKSCFTDCQKGCEGEGHGYTFCEMKCDSDCGTQELKAKLEELVKS